MMADDDLFWDDEVAPTHNNLMQIREAAKPKKTETEQRADWKDKKDLILQYFGRQCGYTYLLIDLQRIISKFAGFSFEWKWSLERISNALALHDGRRRVACCIGPGDRVIDECNKCFDTRSTSMHEDITLKVVGSGHRIKIGVRDRSGKSSWFSGSEQEAKIKTGGMSQMKQDMFGSIFGHLASQRDGVKMFVGFKAGDVIQMRLSRRERNASHCKMEVKHNQRRWVTKGRNIAVPVVICASLYHADGSVAFV